MHLISTPACPTPSPLSQGSHSHTCNTPLSSLRGSITELEFGLVVLGLHCFLRCIVVEAMPGLCCFLRAIPLSPLHSDNPTSVLHRGVFCLLRGGVGFEYGMVSLGLHCLLRLERALCWRSGRCLAGVAFSV